jgi:hypothetical protein
MKTKYLTYPMVVGMALLLVRCGQEKPSPVGAQYYERQNRGTEEHLAAYSTLSDTSYQTSAACGKSYNLFFGADKDIEAYTYVVFSKTINTKPILRAVLSFQTVSYMASGTTPLSVSIYATDTTWEESSMTWKNQALPSSAVPIQTVQIETADTCNVEMEIPPETAAALISADSSLKRIGILLKADVPGCILHAYGREYSSTSDAVPHLTLYLDADTLSVRPEKDAFTAKMDRVPVADRIRIQDGIAERSLLFFNNLTAVPPEATINRALLILRADGETAVPNDTSTFYFTIYPVADSIQSVDNVKVDSASVVIGKIAGDTCRAVITAIIQQWTSKKLKNWGLLLNGYQEQSDLAGRSLYSAQSDSLFMPRLDVFYSLPPSSRF